MYLKLTVLIILYAKYSNSVLYAPYIRPIDYRFSPNLSLALDGYRVEDRIPHEYVFGWNGICIIEKTGLTIKFGVRSATQRFINALNNQHGTLNVTREVEPILCFPYQNMPVLVLRFDDGRSLMYTKGTSNEFFLDYKLLTYDARQHMIWIVCKDYVYAITPDTFFHFFKKNPNVRTVPWKPELVVNTDGWTDMAVVDSHMFYVRGKRIYEWVRNEGEKFQNTTPSDHFPYLYIPDVSAKEPCYASVVSTRVPYVLLYLAFCMYLLVCLIALTVGILRLCNK